MKRIFLAVLMLLFFVAARAQKVYFIYLQSDANAPFFIKMGDKVTSSTPAGYLILPKLVDSTYQFTLGKTGQAGAESRFSITINKKDRGFLLRESDGKLSLFDLQTMTSLQPLAAAHNEAEIIGRRSDPFTVLLAQAASDPSLLEIRATPAVVIETVAPKETQPETAVIASKEPETSTAQTQEQIQDAAVQTSVAGAADAPSIEEKELQETGAATGSIVVAADEKKEPENATVAVTETAPKAEVQEYKRSVVTRRSESSTSEGFGLVFWDEADGVTDTIRIVIPNRNMMTQRNEEEHEDSKKFLDFTNVDSAKEADREKEAAALAVTQQPEINTDAKSTGEDLSVAAANDKLRKAETKRREGCVAEASEKDFFRLRKNMAAEESDEAMIGEAKKAFKKSCFTTEQIKNLSTLFLTASSKYAFFDAAYGHVSNLDQYAALQSELTDEYYVNRFKALIAQQ